MTNNQETDNPRNVDLSPVTGENSGDSGRKPESRIGVSMLIRLTVIIVLVVSLVINIVNIMRYNLLMTQINDTQQQLDEYNRAIAEIQDLINQDVDDEYIAKVAREKFGLHYPDEIIYSNQDGKP